VTSADGRRLILLRHAKSSYPGGVTDRDRPLASRGRREAALAGRWLMSSQPPIGAVLCSPAARARETLERSGISAEATVIPALYGAGPDEIIELIGDVPDEVRTLLVVAHAPGLPATAAMLAGPGSNEDAVAELQRGFPTSAIAVLEVPGPWPSAQYGSCALLTVHVPRA
jgi:phosphohistidine phosphatase